MPVLNVGILPHQLMMCCTSTSRSDGSDAGAITMSHFSNETHKSVIMFHKLLGNGPICDSAQYYSISSALTDDDVARSV